MQDGIRSLLPFLLPFLLPLSKEMNPSTAGRKTAIKRFAPPAHSHTHPHLRFLPISRYFTQLAQHFGFQLYASDPSGNFGGWKAQAIGLNHKNANSMLQSEYKVCRLVESSACPSLMSSTCRLCFSVGEETIFSVADNGMERNAQIIHILNLLSSCIAVIIYN